MLTSPSDPEGREKQHSMCGICDFYREVCTADGTSRRPVVVLSGASGNACTRERQPWDSLPARSCHVLLARRRHRRSF